MTLRTRLHDSALAAYRRTRRFTPVVGETRFNGVPTGDRTRLIDLAVKRWWADPHRSRPNYESGLVAGMRAHVGPGERVVVVGGGHGVTAAVAALAAGPDGRVEAFEASDAMLPLIHRTLHAAGVAGRVTVHHAIVGAAHGVYGATTAAVVTAVPPCDVLVLDCEGAEREILVGLAHRPRVLLVETHGLYGAPTADVRALAEGLGYTVTADVVAETEKAAACARHDIRVLTALHRPS